MTRFYQNHGGNTMGLYKQVFQVNRIKWFESSALYSTEDNFNNY